MAKIAKKTSSAASSVYGLPLEFEPMEAKSAAELPEGEGWQFEPKWDGFRCLAFKEGDNVDLRSKSGKPLGRYFPEVVTFLKSLKVERFVADGELVIEIDGKLSFEDLQMRLHPAESRVLKLSNETPAKFVMFDLLLKPDGSRLVDKLLSERRACLEAFTDDIADGSSISLSPASTDLSQARKWLSLAGSAGSDGVVCKRLDGPYLPGERAMIKVKRLRTADCVVAGFRYESGSDQVGSLLLGLYNGHGELDHVGYTSTITDEERTELTKRLEALKGGAGFSGKAPGGPSRWSTDRSAEWERLHNKLVIEVRFDHVTGHRFRHGTKLMRWRPDKRPDQCTFEQILEAVPWDPTV